MILPYEAAKEIDEFLSEQNISYVIIGEIAVQRWGDPRLTKDVDVTLIVPIDHLPLNPKIQNSYR